MKVGFILNVALENGWRNKSKVVLADGEVVHTAGKGSRPSKVRKDEEMTKTKIIPKNSLHRCGGVFKTGCQRKV